MAELSERRDKSFGRRLFWGIWLISLVVVLGYNWWQLSCGRCCYSDFLIIPGPAWALLALIVLVNGVRVYVKRNRYMRQQFSCQSCDAYLGPEWRFCPYCGDGD